jgi:hypothetical protein
VDSPIRVKIADDNIVRVVNHEGVANPGGDKPIERLVWGDSSGDDSEQSVGGSLEEYRREEARERLVEDEEERHLVPHQLMSQLLLNLHQIATDDASRRLVERLSPAGDDRDRIRTNPLRAEEGRPMEVEDRLAAEDTVEINHRTGEIT